MTKKANRREFLSDSSRLGIGIAAGVWLGTSTRPARAVSANDKINVAVVGIRGRGYCVGMGFAERPDCQVTYLADVDKSLFASRASDGYSRFVPLDMRGPRAESFGKAQGGKLPKCVQDFREVLDDKSVDAIVVATPDHWHALATVWGCQAGKHVYVEKPASHTPWEGRKMVEAARRYNRVVQLGTQSRSAPYMIKAKEYIDSGKLGKIHLCRVYDQKRWGNVQAVPDAATPDYLDWNMWLGPAAHVNYNFNHWEHWNHLWQYSGGDIINDSIHQIDLARWLTGKEYPDRVYSTGGRWAEEGICETPDTQVAIYDFDDMVMTFEMTLYTPYMMLADQELRDSDLFPHWPQNTSRIELFGTEGLMVVGRHGGGWQVFDRPKDRKPVVIAQEYGRWSDKEHREDFCDAIRTNRRPNADIEEGHRSTLLSQFANISYRLGGEKLLVDAKTESFSNNDQANAMLKREYRLPWAIPEEV